MSGTSQAEARPSAALPSTLARASVVNVAVIGAGLMGREVASAFGRWFALLDCPVRPELVGVCDVNATALDWFRQVPGVRYFETDHQALLARPDIDVVYVAVPHHLHEALYLEVLRAGKDLLAEKPFGIDLGAARRIRDAAAHAGRFVRVSSEFPFLPGVQRVIAAYRQGNFGKLLAINNRFLHSSDLDPDKPINWKRQVAYCGEAGVMNDLGLHVAHVPLRLGWRPRRVYAQLQNIHTTRPDGKGGRTACDTWDNASVHGTVEIAGQADVPLTLEMKRMSPTDANTWELEILGTDAGARYSTKQPKTLWTYTRGREQAWCATDLGFAMPFKTITGGIFEPGFPDLLQQMWAAFLAERAGQLNGRFGCATPDEAVAQHELWAAALASQRERRVVELEQSASQT